MVSLILTSKILCTSYLNSDNSVPSVSSPTFSVPTLLSPSTKKSSRKKKNRHKTKHKNSLDNWWVCFYKLSVNLYVQTSSPFFTYDIYM